MNLKPKEKAESILNRYRTFVVMWSGDIQTTNENIKQCALITINEVINEVLHNGLYIDTYLTDDGDKLNSNLKYWYDVRKELSAL